MNEVLFTITKEHLETGLRGYPVGYCTTSFVDPEKGLFYVGRAIKELASLDPIAVIYLLYNGREGTKNEIQAFDKQIKQRAFIDEKVLSHITALPKKGNPMDLFAASIQILGMSEKSGDYKEDCLNIIAKIPLIAAAVINHHAGWEDRIVSEPELGMVENFVQMLGCDIDDRKLFTTLLNLFVILHLDHGGGNLSAFVGKAVASGQQHMYGAIASSMNALAGPRHGRANQNSLEFIQSIVHEVEENPSEEKIEKIIEDKVANHEIIYGFGHAVLRVEDPRASLFYSFGEKHFPDHPLVQTALILRKVAPKILSKNPKISNPYPNIDAMSGAVLMAAGFTSPEYYTILFGLARSIGVAIQIVYERLQAREGKGTPIVRPTYFYKNRPVKED